MHERNPKACASPEIHNLIYRKNERKSDGSNSPVFQDWSFRDASIDLCTVPCMMRLSLVDVVEIPNKSSAKDK